MGLEGLKRKDTDSGPLSKHNDSFVAGAKVRTKVKRVKKYHRVAFSLDDSTDATVDRLSLLPRTFKVSRSKVIRAAVALLAAQTEEEIIRLMQCAQGE